MGDYSKWFIAKSIKCRVALSQPLSLVCARCNPCHDDDYGDYDDGNDDIFAVKIIFILIVMIEVSV